MVGHRPEVRVSGSLVLIADNDTAVSGLLTEVLVRSGLSVRHAFDGEAAREMAREPLVRVLVCDLDMPRLSGIEVLESLATLPVPPQTVVISGYLDAAVQERLQALRYVCHILRKPFDLLEFAGKVRALATGHRAFPAPGTALPILGATEH